MELRLSGGTAAWAIAGLLACAPGSAPVAPPAPTEATAEATAATEPVQGPEGWEGDPDLPEDSPYADLRARLEHQRQEGETQADPLAALREGLARQADAQIESQRWDANRPQAPQPSPSTAAPSDPALSELEDEIAVDEERRRRSEAALRGREERRREAEEAMWKARFEQLRLASLRNCVPSLEYLTQLPGDVVRHRTLRRDDFRAAQMSPIGIDADFEPGAHVSVSLMCITVIRVWEFGSSFEARLDGLRYVALLDREKSWWNEEGEHVSEEWTLRHEQVHFDLAEVEARRLTREADTVVKQLVGRADTPEEAVAELQQLWAEHFEQVRQAFLEMEARYDAETRHGRNPSEQTEWFARAKRGLAESRGATGG